MKTPNSAVINSIEALNYRVTVGDVATKSGLDVQIVQQELLNLASDTNGNLQVAETGDIAYVFSPNFRGILRNKYWRLRWEKFLTKAWQIIFYLIKISFGIILVSSIILMAIAILVIIVAINSKNDDNDGDNGSSNNASFFVVNRWFSPDIFWIFTPDYEEKRYRRNIDDNNKNKLNFLESVYSFLFGDGNPNAKLEEKRWQKIATVIKNNQGAVIAEQIAPYLDNIDMENDNENYILPALIRFNGHPEVSEKGDIIYYFPELQVTAKERKNEQVSSYLKEKTWQFSIASSGQKIFAIFLGGINFILALVLGSLLTPEIASSMGDFISLIYLLYPLLLTYAIAYLTIPLVRYFWLQYRNRKVNYRNYLRQERANLLLSNQELQEKIDYAKLFANQTVINQQNLAYSTEKDLLDQQIEQADKIDEEWRKRLEN